MGTEDLIPFLKKIELFKELSDSEMNLLIPFFRINTYKKGDWIIREGAIGEEIYFIKSGEAEVVKEEQDSDQAHRIAVLKPGEWTGEMSFFENLKRSASVRALETTEVVVMLLKELELSANHETIYFNIVHSLGKGISQRLRYTENSLILSLKEKIKLVQVQNEVSKTIVQIFIIVALYLNLSKFLSAYTQNPLFSLNIAFYPITVLILGASSLWLINSSRYPLSFYGLTLQNWFRNTLEAIPLTIPILILLVILKWILVTSIPLFNDTPIFEFRTLGQSTWNYAFFLIIDIALVPVQEITVRSFLQCSFRNFFQSPHRVFFAILASNMVFDILRTESDAIYALFSFLFGIFWGYMFEKQKSIVGTSVSHGLARIMAFFILRFDKMIMISQ